MDMPGGISFTNYSTSYFGGNITLAVNNGSLSEARLVDMITRIMTPYYLLGQDVDHPAVDGEEPTLNTFDPMPYISQYTYGPANVDVRDDHATLIRELGAAGTVLLKNVNNALPLRSPSTIGVFGNDAGDVVDGLYLNGAAFGEFGSGKQSSMNTIHVRY